MAGLSMREMPGILELFAADPQKKKEIWSSICDYVVKKMSYCAKKQEKLEEAKGDIAAFDGSQFTDYELFIAECDELFDVAKSWYGKTLLDDFHLLQWYKQRCRQRY